MTVYVYTSIALNYFPKSRVLSTSLKKFHPDWKFCVVISEDFSEKTRQKILSFNDIDEVISYKDLQLTDGFGHELSKIQARQWQFKHSITEFCTAVKGSALVYLLNKADCEAAFYFDPDMAIFDSLLQLTNHFNNPHTSLLLTPHLITPESTLEAVWDNEICAMKHGIYNLGFIGVKNDFTGKNFANWWRNRLDMYCYADIPNGIFTDQRWCDAIPAFFDGVKVLREPQFNIATWNISNRSINGSDIMNLIVNEKYKLCFYHFSGFDSGAQLMMLKKYGKNAPKLFELREWYINKCRELDDPEISKLKWQFNYYSNGEKIPESHRSIYRDRPELHKIFIDPFDTNHSLSLWIKHNYHNPPIYTYLMQKFKNFLKIKYSKQFYFLKKIFKN